MSYLAITLLVVFSLLWFNVGYFAEQLTKFMERRCIQCTHCRCSIRRGKEEWLDPKDGPLCHKCCYHSYQKLFREEAD